VSGHIVSVNVSPGKGTSKTPQAAVEVDALGVVGDAHAGIGHRQVSLLAQESIDGFAARSGRTYRPGDFGENVTTAGLDLAGVCLRDRLTVASLCLEVTQIGKTCHGDGCAIFREVGKCIMPKEGVFCRVLRGGPLRPGDPIDLEEGFLAVSVVTVSDRASRGEYADRSGPAVVAALREHLERRRWRLAVRTQVVPDESEPLRSAVESAVAAKVDVLFTTGGTGIGPRDITPETIRPLLDKELPGIMEYIRVRHGERLPSALLSRGVAGTRGQTLIFTLPGSPSGAREHVAEILRPLEHALAMLASMDCHPASSS
jgi:molybdenum cofactor synthesis domain-containing protein